MTATKATTRLLFCMSVAGLSCFNVHFSNVRIAKDEMIRTSLVTMIDNFELQNAVNLSQFEEISVKSVIPTSSIFTNSIKITANVGGAKGEIVNENVIKVSEKPKKIPTRWNTTARERLAAKRYREQPQRIYKYNICNGLSNQLLHHAASIVAAIEQVYDVVEIPDYFIVNGMQENGADILPHKNNSIDFASAFDAAYFFTIVEKFGITPRFVRFDVDNSTSSLHRAKREIPCAGMQALIGKNPDMVLQIVKAFRPSSTIQMVADKIMSKMGNNDDVYKSGVCVHHRNGKDWREHCKRWSAITKKDGIYRGNCLGPERLKDQLISRILDDDHHWIYYCGDSNNIPYLLKNNFKYPVVSRHTLLSTDDVALVNNLKPDQFVRDLWALVDFSVCQNLVHFVGNSVSTFSAIQLALRKGEKAYWYNSQGLPLAELWRIYQVPIVYTYTEQSAAPGKHLLQASIASVRKHMPNNLIHILYHGSSDYQFFEWLKQQNVRIHRHLPVWKDIIEEMRQHGDPSLSHLFSHAGNYLGTWQRIDIPLFVESEYILLLDADTIVTRQFTLADFGQHLARSIAMSSESIIDDLPANAGVTLMNVPVLRRTYNGFLKFITAHSQSPQFSNSGPSDQGAYLEFYKPYFLSRCFNFKPYYNFSDIECAEPFVVHFHGAKPHDYLNHMKENFCDDAFIHLCDKALHTKPLCKSLQLFAQASQSVDKVAYCQNTMPKKHVSFCNQMMHVLAELAEKNKDCLDVTVIANSILKKIPA